MTPTVILDILAEEWKARNRPTLPPEAENPNANLAPFTSTIRRGALANPENYGEVQRECNNTMTTIEFGEQAYAIEKHPQIEQIEDDIERDTCISVACNRHEHKYPNSEAL